MYFIIIFVLVATALVVWLIYAKEYWQIRNCSITTGVTLGVYLLCWPYAIRQIFESGRGISSFENLRQTAGFRNSITEFYEIIDTELFGGSLIPFTIILFVLLAVVLLTWLRKRKADIGGNDVSKASILLLMVSTVAYLLLVAKTVPDILNRYISATYPSIILLFLALYHIALRRIAGIKLEASILVIVSAIIITMGFYNKPVDYLYSDTPDVSSFIQNYETPSLIVVMEQDLLWDKNEKFLLDFIEFSRTFISKTIDDFPIALKDVSEGDELLIYLDLKIDPDEFFTKMHKTLPFEDAMPLYTRGHYHAYSIVW